MRELRKKEECRDYDAFNNDNEREEIVEAFEWCNQHLSSCSNLSMANRDLSILDISERFIEDGGLLSENKLYV